MLTDAQVNAIVNAVCAKADKMVANRVAARGGTAKDHAVVKRAIAERLG